MRPRVIGICNFVILVNCAPKHAVTFCAPLSNAREIPLSIVLLPECSDLCHSQTFQSNYSEELRKINMQKSYTP